MHAAQASPRHLHGLGVHGADTGGNGPYPRLPQCSSSGSLGVPSTPPRNSPAYRGGGAPVSPSPQRTAPTPLRGSPARPRPDSGYLPPSPTLGHGRSGNGSPASNAPSPSRFRIANPDPAPHHHQQQQQHAQAQAQQQQQQQRGGNLALRPTHTFTPRSQFTATSFSSIPPAEQTQNPFSPASSSPLKSRLDYNNRNTTDSDYQNGASHKPQLRPSKSAEILKKLTGNENKNAYQPIGDDDEDDEERLRLPGDRTRNTGPQQVVRSPSGAATSLAAGFSNSPSWNGSEQRLILDFPTPPAPMPGFQRHSTGTLDDPTPQTSQDSFVTATQEPNNFSSDDSLASANSTPKANRRKSMPYPASAAPENSKRSSTGSPYPARHSRDEALLAAETGGMVRLGTEGYAAGDSPGIPVSRHVPGTRSALSGSPRHSPRLPLAAPDYPPPLAPAATRRSTASDPRLDFTRPRSGLTPQFTPEVTPDSTPSAEGISAWAPDSAGPRRRHGRSNSDGIALLARQGTLFHPGSNNERASQELDVMLGKPKSRRLSASALLPLPEAPKDKVRLEASKKSKARVELDVVIEREAVVEGGELRGRFEVVVRGGKRGHGLRVGRGKLRVIGYEEVGGNAGTRHIFYQHQYPLPIFQNQEGGPHSSLFADDADEEGFHLAVEGTHAIPFSCPLPVGGGAKGSFSSNTPKGPNVRYVVVGSVKLHIPKSGKRAIAHFYRPLVVLPYHNPGVILSPALEPIVQRVEHGLGWSIGGEKGRVAMQVALGRSVWVAGQRVWCEIGVTNNSNKKINKCALAILQTVNTFGTSSGGMCKSGGAFESTERRKVAEEITEADFMDVGSGHITGKSWWTGLEPGESSRWDMSVAIPTGMLSIPRSRYVEVNYVLRVTLNGSIYVDVPIDLISFLSIDPPPMPSDTRHMRGRIPSKTQVQPPHHMLSSVPELPMGPQPPMNAGNRMSNIQQRQMVDPQQRQSYASTASPAKRSLDISQSHSGSSQSHGQNVATSSQGHGFSAILSTSSQGHGVPIATSPATMSAEGLPEPYSRSDASPTLGANNPSMGYTTEQLQTAPINMSSRHSSTTLNIDALLAEGRERAAQGASPVPNDLNPRVASPGSQYSTLQGGSSYLAVPSTNTRDLRHKVSQEFSDVHSVDEEERNHLAIEEHRREGREKSLAVLQQSNANEEELDLASEDSHGLDPEDQRVFAPATEPTGEAFDIDQTTEAGSTVGDSENDRTPVVSPRATPVLPARAAFLHHISEEEEPLDDDTFDEMMSSEGHGSHLHFEGDNNDDDDDLLAAQDTDTTPRVSRYEEEMPGGWSAEEEPPRRSLEDRLARACTATPPAGAVAAGAAGAAIGPAAIGASAVSTAAHGREDVRSRGREDVKSFQSVDYNEPLDVDTLSIAEHDDGYDADNISEKDSTFGRTSPFARHAHSLSLPGGMSLKRDPPPALPSSGSVRDMKWDAAPSTMANLEIEEPIATPTSATFGTAPHSPRHFDAQPLAGGRSLAALYADEMSSLKAPDRSVLARAASPSSKDSSSGRSFHTAETEGDDLPPLARSATSSESASSEAVESPPTVSQPVYSTPLPVPPADEQRTLNVPGRFRPPPAMSEESHDSYEASTVSTAHSVILPSVKARAQQFETREEALRKFTVAGSTGLSSPARSEFSIAPLSPARSGTDSPGGKQRRSYTAALAPRPTTPSRATVTKAVSSPMSPAFGLETQTPRDALLDYARRQDSQHITITEGHKAGSASQLLSRALSNSSVSTTATDMERSLASPIKSPLLGPRGPRQLRREKEEATTQADSTYTHETQWTSSTHDSDFTPPQVAAAELDSSSMRKSPAQTLQKALHVEEVTSQRASLEDMPGSPTMSTETMSEQLSGEGDESAGTASDFGSTGWAGGMRLPARLPQRQGLDQIWQGR